MKSFAPGNLLLIRSIVYSSQYITVYRYLECEGDKV